MLQGAAAMLAAPWIVRDAFASSGQLNLLGWSGVEMAPVFKLFTAKTGITVNFLAAPDNATMLAQARLAAQNGAIDCAEPTLDQVPLYLSGNLVQPWDMSKIPLESYESGLVSGEIGKRSISGGKRHFLPSTWGTEALVFDTLRKPEVYGTASLADLFDPGNAGRVMLRPVSGLTALGRLLDAQGKLPLPLADSFRGDDATRKVWDVILAEALKHRANVGAFWSGMQDAQQGFRGNACTLGLCWDAIGFALQADNQPVSYIAPKEGAFAWSQGYMLLRGAKNTAQAIEWVKFTATPQGSAANAKAFSANPSAKGAVALLDPAFAKFYAAAYPEDAVSRLWWWPASTEAFLKTRAEYGDRFLKG